MSTLWISAATGLALAGQPLPDQLDILRGADTTPQIQLLLDSSCSMGWNPAPSVCTFYPSSQSTMIGSYESGGTWFLSRTDQLKAALTGCREEGDGILDLWSSRVLFSIREFGGGRQGLLAPFDPTLSNQAALESAVLGLPASGGTPLAPSYQKAALNFDSFFNDANTKRCRQNYIVVMSDGVGNSSGDVLFDFVPGNADITVRDANYCFGSTGSGCPSPPYLDEAARYLLETDSGQTSDVLSQVDGEQPIRTYTIGFQAPAAADALLEAMAVNGDGRAYSATSYEQLSAAFAEIVASIVARARVNFNAGSVEADGLFSGNYLYLSVFRPKENGHWLGTTKKYCVLPSGTSSGCLFENGLSGQLEVNPKPVDLWTGSDAIDANVGGTGEVMLSQTFGVSSVVAAPPANPLSRRTILTWQAGQSGYIPVTPSSLDTKDTWTSHPCDHHSLLNSLHGFSEDVSDCAAGDYSPIAFDSWPVGDTVHGGTILLQYTPECEAAGDRCYAATVANDGMLHFYNAVTGVETSAVIPAELWRPNTIAHHRLDDRGDQPGPDVTRRYYFDGSLSLHHIDEDGDGVIEAGEEAQLIAGLGRGGRGYYLFDVLDFNGVPDATKNPPRPLLADETTGFRNLMDTWSAPWTGTMEITAGLQRTVAVFPSGHVPELDDPDAALAVLPTSPPRASLDRESQPTSLNCADVGLPAELCTTPDPASFCPLFGLTCAPGACSPCPFADVVDCNNAGFAEPFCYDWPGMSTLPVDLGIWAQSPIDVVAGPLTYEAGDRQGLAYRVNFSRFDLQPGDYVSFTDTRGSEVVRISGAATATSTPWIYDERFTMRVVTNGANDAAALGFTISSIDTLLGPSPAPTGEVHRPSLFVVDLARWNANQDLTAPYASSDPGVFAAAPTGGDARQAAALRFRITSECEGSTGTDEICVDRNTNPNTEDLRWMTCPISAEPTVYTEGGLLRTIYIGDECGQIWAADYDANDAWTVRRLLRLNASDGDGFTVRGGSSRDYRKIFNKLELVISACPGTRARGIYFGSGNVQRPAALDTLTDTTVSSFSGSLRGSSRNVVGVVWDTPLLSTGASLSDLINVSDQASIGNPSASGNQAGWYIELAEDERMLRDPLVFDGVAYFDVFRPTRAPTECISALGESRTLFLDNCTAEPLDPSIAGTPDQQRTTSVRTDSTIGGGFLVLTPQGGDPIVTLGQNGSGAAALPNNSKRKTLRLFLWRP
ncbi:MAG: hypothetical protein AAFZ18_36845 [Myxococcota bacterium]